MSAPAARLEDDDRDEERTLRGDLEHLTQLAQTAIKREPLLAVAVAAGLGFALGGGLSRQLLVALAGMGARAAADFAADGLFSRTRSARAESERGDFSDDSL